MEKNRQLFKTTLLITIIAAVTCLLWLIIFIIEAQNQAAVISPESAIHYLQNAGLLFYITYINAVLVTISATLFMSCLYVQCRKMQPVWAFLGAVFIPAYFVMNLFSYGSQISIIPHLLSFLESPDNQPALVLLISQLTHAWQPTSISALINLAAYAVLGIPSIIFGIILMKHQANLKWAALFLLLNGIACILGIIGAAAGISWMVFGCALGGMLYLVSLVLFIYALLNPDFAVGIVTRQRKP